ncbi:MAG: glutamate racemase, partial [bacterium]
MIGVFDSGLGGISVLNALRKKFPKSDYLYFGDTARVPYGTRSEAIIRQYCAEGVDYLKTQGIDLIVVACNTATAVALDIFEASGLPIVNVIDPTVLHVKQSGWKRVAVIGTAATVNSHVYAKKLQEVGVPIMQEVACSLFVPLVEEGFEKHEAAYLIAQKYLMPLAGKGLDALILGCTHYPFLEPVISRVLG